LVGKYDNFRQKLNKLVKNTRALQERFFDTVGLAVPQSSQDISDFTWRRIS
jgi:hypothetical protein